MNTPPSSRQPCLTTEDQARIFNRFGRAVQANEVSGRGLGLYISREIVEAHGGTLTGASQLGHGSVFTMELPITLSH